MMINKYAVDEFIQNCRSRDAIKARLVLDYFIELEPGDRRRILLEITKSEDDFGLPLLVYLAVKHPDTVSEFQTLAETIVDKARNHPELIISQLNHDQPERFYYVDLARDLGLRDTTIGLLKQANQNELTRLLSEQLGNDREEDQLILDYFAKNLDEIALQSLVSSLTADNAQVRNHGKLKLRQIGEKAVPYIIPQIFTKDTDLQIHSLNLLQEIGDKSSISPIRKLINSQPADPNVRFAAYEALANLPFRKGDYLLASGLTDLDDGVRLAAARAIDQHFDQTFLDGIKNMIGYEDEDAVNIAKAIFDAQTRQLFLNLLDQPFFKKMISGYLAVKAHPEVREFHVQLLKESNQVELARDIVLLSGEIAENESTFRICAVDDSRMILSLYRQMLNDLGIDPMLFEHPKKFIEWLENSPGELEKPDLVFTDLNMPEITGIDLILRVRSRFDKDQLPIVMVTTQTQGEDHKMAYGAGANAVIFKPFDKTKLQEVIDQYIQ